MKNFENKVAVVSGAGSGIGRALALNLANRGAQLALSDIDGEGLGETVVLCEKIGARTVPYQLDVSDRSAVYSHADASSANSDASTSLRTTPAWHWAPMWWT